MARTYALMTDPGTTKSGNSASSFGISLNTSHFDTAYSKAAFLVGETGGSLGNVVATHESTNAGAGNTNWMHALCYVSTGGNTDGSITMVTPTVGSSGSTGDRVGIFKEDDADSFIFAAVNDAHSSVLASEPIIGTVPLDTLFTIDIKFSGINEFTLYLNGTLDAVLDTSAASISNHTIRTDATAAANAWTGAYCSQVHITSYPTIDTVGSIGSNVLMLYPDAESTPNEWTGDVASVSTPDNTDGQSGSEYTGTSGQDQMFTFDQIPGGLSSRPITSVAVGIRGQDTDAAADTTVEVDSGGATPVATGSNVGIVHFFYSVASNMYNSNSLTSADWTHAEVNALKAGFTTT